MERLISLFRRPEDFEFAAADENYPYPWLDQADGDEPPYFTQLMQYLRQQKNDDDRGGAD